MSGSVTGFVRMSPKAALGPDSPIGLRRDRPVVPNILRPASQSVSDSPGPTQSRQSSCCEAVIQWAGWRPARESQAHPLRPLPWSICNIRRSSTSVTSRWVPSDARRSGACALQPCETERGPRPQARALQARDRSSRRTR